MPSPSKKRIFYDPAVPPGSSLNIVRRYYVSSYLKLRAGRLNNGNRNEQYAVFAKSFKKRIEEPGLFLFDMKDLERAMK